MVFTLTIGSLSTQNWHILAFHKLSHLFLWSNVSRYLICLSATKGRWFQIEDCKNENPHRLEARGETITHPTNGIRMQISLKYSHARLIRICFSGDHVELCRSLLCRLKMNGSFRSNFARFRNFKSSGCTVVPVSPNIFDANTQKELEKHPTKLTSETLSFPKEMILFCGASSAQNNSSCITGLSSLIQTYHTR